jgi:hypothetical protein
MFEFFRNTFAQTRKKDIESMEGSQQQYPVLPPHTVAKAVVIFVQGVPFADLEQQHSEGLDRLAQLGCSGRLFPRLLRMPTPHLEINHIPFIAEGHIKSAQSYYI